MPFDLYSEEHAPEVAYNATVYFMHIPFKHRAAWQADGYKVVPFVYLEVDRYDWVTVKSYCWFDRHSNNGKTWEDQKAILEYLQEWEYVELRPIGPEDAEWFATDKLLNLPKTTWRDDGPTTG